MVEADIPKTVIATLFKLLESTKAVFSFPPGEVKLLLSDCSVPVYQEPEAILTFSTDASQIVVDAVLEQWKETVV
ncbi:hypothetical protein ACTXT7_015480 [Hymenolepis weldensis]